MTGCRRNGVTAGSTRQWMSAMSNLRVTATTNPTAPCRIQTFYNNDKQLLEANSKFNPNSIWQPVSLLKVSIGKHFHTAVLRQTLSDH